MSESEAIINDFYTDLMYQLPSKAMGKSGV